MAPAEARPGRGAPDDPTVATLAQLFREHPAWCAAAAHLRDDASSAVWFRHLPGRPWRLVRHAGRSELLAGREPDPDLVFRFTPAAVERLAGVSGGVGDFAVALFELLAEGDPERRVDLRVAAPFARLARRGYVTLLLRAGPAVAAYGVSRGVRGLADLRRLVVSHRSRDPAPWEGS